MPWRPSSSSHLATVALLAAIGIVLHVVESFVPLPVPFLKLGLANVSSVVALFLLSPRDMVIVMLLRVFIGAILIGSLFSPAFLVGLSSGAAAVAAMWMAHGVRPGLFSPVGISLIGSVTHVMMQLLVVSYLFVRDFSLVVLLPLLLVTGLAGGLVVGIVSVRLVGVMKAQESA